MLGIFGMPGGLEFIIILLIILLIFGKKIPGIANSLGKGIVEFKKGLKGIKNNKEKDNHSDLNKDKKC